MNPAPFRLPLPARLAVGLLAVLVSWCPAARAAQVVLSIDSDTYVDSAAANADVNYGTSGSVKVLINGTDSSVCRGLFQLPPETADYAADRIVRAHVGFYLFSDRTEDRNVTLYPLTRSFSEDGATWNSADGSNAWTSAGGDFDTNYPVAASKDSDGFFRWDITDLLADPAARENLLTYGALLQIDETPVPTNMPRAPFTSSDSASENERPFLQLTVRPQFTYPIDSDTYVDSAAANADINYGTGGSVKVLINGSDGSVCRGLFQLPPEAIAYDTNKLSKAQVGFFLFSDRTEDRNVTLYPLTRSFSEDGATWNSADGSNAWTSAGGDFDTNYPVAASKDSDGFFRWDITGLLTDPAARSNLVTYGALLQIDETPAPTNMPRAPFTSSDSASESERPFVQMIANAQVSFPIVNDAHLDSRDTGKNFGASTVVKVVVNAATNRDGTVTRGLFQFPPEVGDLETDDVDTVKVVFFASRDLTGERPVTLYPLTRAFVPGTGNGTTNADGATWDTVDGSNAWTSAGGDFDSTRGVEAVKEPLFDADMRSRYFTWDITGLLTDESSRSNLLANGAILIIDESRPCYETDVDDMPRVPFNSADHTDVAFHPFIHATLVARQASVPDFSFAEDGHIQLGIDDCTPYVSYRIECSPSLASPVWTTVTNVMSTNGSSINWSGMPEAGVSNAYYRIVVE